MLRISLVWALETRPAPGLGDARHSSTGSNLQRPPSHHRHRHRHRQVSSDTNSGVLDLTDSLYSVAAAAASTPQSEMCPMLMAVRNANTPEEIQHLLDTVLAVTPEDMAVLDSMFF